MIVPFTALFIIGLAATSVSAQKEICERLSQCLADVKAKEVSCQQESAVPKADADASVDAAKAECAEAVKSKGDALRALIQRKADAYGSCINTKAASAVGITNGKKKERCDALLARQSRVRRLANEDEEDSKPRKAGRRGGSRRSRPKAMEQNTSCQSELRQLRTRCAKLSKCCSVTKECRKGDSSIDQEIKAARAALRTQNRQCRGSKVAGNKAKEGRRPGQKGRGNKAKTTTVAPPSAN